MRRNPPYRSMPGSPMRVGSFGDVGSNPGGMMHPMIQPVQVGAAAALPPNIETPLQGILDPQLDGADYFFYQTLVQGLSSTAPNGTSQIQIDAGTDFLWIATTYQADLAAAAQTINSLPVPLVTLLMTDTGATKNLSNAPTPLNCIAGTAEFPYRLIQPRLFRASSVINFTWTSYVAAGTTYSNIYLVMHGIRMIAGTFNLQP